MSGDSQASAAFSYCSRAPGAQNGHLHEISVQVGIRNKLGLCRTKME